MYIHLCQGVAVFFFLVYALSLKSQLYLVLVNLLGILFFLKRGISRVNAKFRRIEQFKE